MLLKTKDRCGKLGSETGMHMKTIESLRCPGSWCHWPEVVAISRSDSRPAGNGKWQENAKKILNRGNKPKDLLKTNDLADFRAKNKPKTNPKKLDFYHKKCKSKRKKQDLGVRNQDSGIGGGAPIFDTLMPVCDNVASNVGRLSGAERDYG